MNIKHGEKWISRTVISIIRESHKAWLIKTEKGTHWFPKSQCILDKEENLIFIKEWFMPQLVKYSPEPKEEKQLQLF